MTFNKGILQVFTLAAWVVFYFRASLFRVARETAEKNLRYKANDQWQGTNFDSITPKEIFKYLKWENNGSCRFYQGK